MKTLKLSDEQVNMVVEAVRLKVASLNRAQRSAMPQLSEVYKSILAEYNILVGVLEGGTPDEKAQDKS